MNRRLDLRLRFGAQVGPGRLITVDGLDGCGKTTLTESLRRHLCALGMTAVVTRLPTPELRQSRSFELLQRQGRTDLIDPVAFEVEYMVDRIQHCRTFIEPALRNGIHVITDRYALSSVGSLLLRLRDLREVAIRAVTGEAWFRDLCKYLTAPHLSYLVHVDARTSTSRVKARVEEAAYHLDLDEYAALQNLLHEIAEANNMVPIHTGSSPEASLAACLPHLERILAGADQVASP